MGTISVTETVAAPPERVFDMATDLSRAAERIDGIESVEVLTDGPVGVGTRWRETRRGMGTEELEITGYDPPRSYDAECESCGCHFASRLGFEPTAEGTLVTMQISSRPLTLFAKLMAPVSALMAGAMRKALAADLAAIKRAAEADEQ